MTIPKDILKLIFVLDLTFLVLLAFSFPHIEPGTGSYVVAMLTLLAIGLTMSTIAVLLFVERRRSEKDTA